jgi:hypothetical protein
MKRVFATLSALSVCAVQALAHGGGAHGHRSPQQMDFSKVQ